MYVQLKTKFGLSVKWALFSNPLT